MTRRLSIFSTLVLALAATGCVSRMAGERRRPAAPGQEPLLGIPFTMTKPVYFVTMTPGPGGTAKFELKVEWVADTCQQYTVTLDPAVFADTSFVMALGEHGEVIDLNAAITDKAGPTIQAIGEFIGGVAGTIAGVRFPLGAGGGKDAVSDGLLGRLVRWRKDLAVKKEVLVWDPSFTPALDRGQPTQGACTYKSLLDYHWRGPSPEEVDGLNELIKAVQQDGVAAPEVNLMRAIPFTTRQRIWLESARELLACEVKTAAQNKVSEDAIARLESLSRSRAMIEAALAAIKTAEARPFELLLFDLWQSVLRGELTDVKNRVESWNKALDQVPTVSKAIEDALTRLQELEGPKATKLSAAELRTRVGVDAMAATPAAQSADFLKDQAALVKVLLDADDNWTYRIVSRLEAEIESLKKDLARNPSNSISLAALEQRRLEIERLTGAEVEGARLRLVQKRLVAIEGSGRLRAPEYTALQQSMTTLVAAIQQKRAAVRLPEPPVPGPKRFPVLITDGSPGTTEADAKAIANGADFLLVRERGYNR